MQIKFNENFWWGAATSGPQSEGSFDKKNMNIMDYWFLKKPDDFHNYIGPRTASDVFHNYKNDIKIMKDLNLNSFRTSIQWTRIIKNFETNEIDENGVQFYRNYFQELKKNNIKLIANLYHFDLPMFYQKKGGWENRETIQGYVDYAKICFELFGDLVDKWATFNEPLVPAEAGYLEGVHYPKIKDIKRAILVGYNTMLASAKAIKIFKDMFSNNIKKEISIILNLTPTYPRNSKNKNDVYAAKIRDLLFNKSFLDAAVYGIFNPELINFINQNNLLTDKEETDYDDFKNGIVDFLGVNFYQPLRVKAEFDDINSVMNNVDNVQQFFSYYRDPDAIYNEYRGWEIRPNTLYEIAMDIKNNYKNIKWYVAENGMGVEGEEKFKRNGIINDDYRIEFIKEHLFWLNKAIKKGSNCFGYHLWTFIDCWSWANSYKNRYGLVELNIFNQKRTIKKSGYWLSENIKKSSFEIEEELTKPYK